MKERVSNSWALGCVLPQAPPHPPPQLFRAHLFLQPLSLSNEKPKQALSNGRNVWLSYQRRLLSGPLPARPGGNRSRLGQRCVHQPQRGRPDSGGVRPRLVGRQGLKCSSGQPARRLCGTSRDWDPEKPQ